MFFFYCFSFLCHIEDIFAKPKIAKIFPMLSSRGFTVLEFIFRCIIQLELHFDMVYPK